MAFDYRQFLAENKLTKVSKGQEAGKAQILSEGIRISEGFDDGMEMDEANKAKEDYLKRKEREEKGNWEGSVGAFVEKHGEDIAGLKTMKDIDVFIETVMVPELGDEAVEYVRNLRANSKSPYRFITALYDATLKGSGLGLHEASACDECDDWDETEEVAWEDDGDEYPVNLQEMALNHASLGGERNRKKPGVKPGSAGQDKMAKSEMKGDEIEVTIGGVKKAVSQRAFNKYRKMTDPEEKKAWKKKYGFIKEGKVLKEGMEHSLESYLRAIWNEYRSQIGDGTLHIELTKDGGSVKSDLGKDLYQVSFKEETV